MIYSEWFYIVKRFSRSAGCCRRGDRTVFLLEYLEGDGGVLDGYDHPAVVKVKDVMLLLKNLVWSNTKASRAPLPDGEKQRVFLRVLLSRQTTDRSSVQRERRREWEMRVRQEDVMYLSPRLPAVWSDVHLLLILHQLGAKVTWRKEEDRKLLPILSICLKRHLI